MNKKKKFLIALVVILVPVIGFGFNYFRWDGNDQVSKQTLTVNGGISIENISADQKLVPGDKICDTIGFDIKSTAPSLLRVKVETFCGDDTTPVDIGIVEGVDKNWVNGNDGYYYYTKTVDQSTGVLQFASDLKFGTETGEDLNQYQDQYIKAKITAEMVQAKYGVFETAWEMDSTHPAYAQLKTASDQVTPSN